RHGHELASVYASSDIFCFPSTTDTFGQVLLEAGASGLPVVAVSAGGATELVGDGANGVLVPPDDPASFARAVTLLASSEELRRGLGQAGRSQALAWAWDESFEQLRSAYRSVVGARPVAVERRLAPRAR